MTLSTFFHEKEIVPGVVSLYKPYGVSSTGVTEVYKRATKQKAGHGGTLDPLAEGELILGIGQGTKKLTQVLSSDKQYRTSLIIGLYSPSGDLELPVEPRSVEKVITKNEIDSVLDRMKEGITHAMTAYSAVKIDGKAAYDRVRSGETPEMKEVTTKLLSYTLNSFEVIDEKTLQSMLAERREARIKNVSEFENIAEESGYNARKYRFLSEKWDRSYELTRAALDHLVQWQGYLLDISIHVPKGTYVRSIAQLIGLQFNSEATVLTLIREHKP